MIDVYHMNRDKMTSDQRWSVSSPVDSQATDAKALYDAGLYDKVATVDTTELETAWHLTNSIHTSWSVEPDSRVTVIAPLRVSEGKTYGLKSSEMGDIFVQDGTLYVVADVGFTALPE